MSELDNTTATVTVADAGTTPAAATDTGASATPPTEAPNGEAAPANPQAQAPAEEPEWFKQRIKQTTRQRREAERRADKLASELEEIKRSIQPAQPKSADLRPNDFPTYDAYVEAVVEAKTAEKIGALTRGNSEQADLQAKRNVLETFKEKATEQAEAAGIDFDAVMETLSQAPRLSQAVVGYLAESTHSARLAEHLAENPDELDRVSRLGPAMAKTALAKMEVAFGGTPAKPANGTKAPPPVPAVGGRAVTQIDPSKMSMDDYAKHWAKRNEANN